MSMRSTLPKGIGRDLSRLQGAAKRGVKPTPTADAGTARVPVGAAPVAAASSGERREGRRQ
jgi:hypothetical protein